MMQYRLSTLQVHGVMAFSAIFQQISNPLSSNAPSHITRGWTYFLIPK
jgi:hypothetical protein